MQMQAGSFLHHHAHASILGPVSVWLHIPELPPSTIWPGQHREESEDEVNLPEVVQGANGGLQMQDSPVETPLLHQQVGLAGGLRGGILADVLGWGSGKKVSLVFCISGTTLLYMNYFIRKTLTVIALVVTNYHGKRPLYKPDYGENWWGRKGGSKDGHGAWCWNKVEGSISEEK